MGALDYNPGYYPTVFNKEGVNANAYGAIQHFRELTVGAGTEITMLDSQGTKWGGRTFDNAQAWIKNDGTFKLKTDGGTTILDSSGAGGNYVQVINSVLDTTSKEILSDFDFGTTDYAGAVKAGDITWNTSTGAITGGSGVAIYRGGIVGASAGVATFTINSATGSATFAGTLSAASGSLGAITIGSNAWHVDSSGNMWWGNYADYASAIIKISNTGSIDFSTGNIVGATIKATSSTSGSNIFLDPTNKRISFLYNNVERGFIYANSSGQLVIDADSLIYLKCDGAGDDIWSIAQDNNLVQSTGGKVWLWSAGDTWVECDNHKIYYNDDNDGSDVYWYSNNVLKMKLTSGGNLEIAGTLSKGGGSFKIDHPLKPDTHYLYHSFVESPDMLNIYKGRGTTVNGKCKVQLPDYFEALNKDIEYQLTPIKSLARLGISKEVKNNEFEVMSDEDCEFSWIVMGVRQDKFALANPIITEVEKEEVGYIYPELYGEEPIKDDSVKKEKERMKNKSKK